MVRRWMNKEQVRVPGWYFQSFVDAPGSRGIVQIKTNMQGNELLIATCGESLSLADSSIRALYYGPIRNPPLTPIEFGNREAAHA